jgi:MoaA/NifB/PqqE/SkfB family radical SAM enzyme
VNQLPKVDIIWNSTLVCPHDCAVCCVDAIHVTRRGDSIKIRSKGLTAVEEIAYVKGNGSIFDQALAYRQRRGLELSLAEKLRVLDHLDGFEAKLDISGGDPLRMEENLTLLRAAASRVGQSRLTLTATGVGLTAIDPGEVSGYIGELNFTYDSPDRGGNIVRPDNYASVNLKVATEFARLGVKTRGECPLTKQIADEAILRRIYRNLHDAGIERMLVMRLFPVGRGQLLADAIPTRDDYRRAIDVLRREESRLSWPKVSLQCALRNLEPEPDAANPCDMVTESFGLMANGVLLMSPWAVNAVGMPLHDAYVLGNLATTPLSDLLAEERIVRLRPRLDENRGHCKIFSFLNSAKADPVERMLDEVDPLYADVAASPTAYHDLQPARSQRVAATKSRPPGRRNEVSTG